MKKVYLFLFAVCALLGLWFWWKSDQPANQVVLQPKAVDTNEIAPSPPLKEAESRGTTGASVAAESMPSTNSASWIEQRRKQMDDATAKAQSRWRTPIEFYGKVVDEETNAVAGAEVHFSYTDLSPTGNSEKQTTSDGNGVFELRDAAGMNLIVTVSKQGYYAYEPFKAFNYAGRNESIVPDQANPVVFRMRKKGVTEPLIRFRKPFDVPKDGSPIWVDLATGNLATSSHTGFQVECWTRDAGKKPGEHFDWKCRVSVVGGGIQRSIDQFPFLAPTSGYLTTDEIDMTVKPDQPWQQDVERRYFIQTLDGKFGRMTFKMIAHGEHFCLIESYFNPSGSRNLEFDANSVASGTN